MLSSSPSSNAATRAFCVADVRLVIVMSGLGRPAFIGGRLDTPTNKYLIQSHTIFEAAGPSTAQHVSWQVVESCLLPMC